MLTAARTERPSRRLRGGETPRGAARRALPLRCAIVLFALGAASGLAPARAADEPPAAPPSAASPTDAQPPARPEPTPPGYETPVGAGPLGPNPADDPALYDYTFPVPQAAPDDPADAFAKGTFWRIEKAGELRGFVLGTLHIGELAALGVPEEAFRRLAESNALVVEIAPAGYSAERAEALRSLPPGTELRALLGDTSYALAERVASDANLDGAALARLQPWAAIALLQAASHLPERSLDDVLIARGQALGLDVIGLETLEEQFGAFGCVPLEGQALVMRETLAAHARFRELNEATLRLYREQDLQGLMRYLTTSIPLSEPAKALDDRSTHCVIDERNRVLAERLEPLLETRIAFVAIGALHLTGGDGVLARLVRRGYRVVPYGVEPATTRKGFGAPSADLTLTDD